jgi:putative transcriptional regulator
LSWIKAGQPGAAQGEKYEDDVPSLTGQLLIAMPQMEDPRFARSVVYLFAHGEETGAMGIIINKPIENMAADELYAHLKIEAPVAKAAAEPVYFGGPVGTDLGFVLHDAAWREAGTVAIDDDFALTATLDMLRAMARGFGPARRILALGYAGWAPLQLEDEIKANGWLVVAADPALVFETDDAGKWSRALGKLGVKPEMLSGGVGRA